jgi:PAS domain S-box-containing protein
MVPEETLRHLLRAFLDNIPDHVYFKDLDSRFMAVSSTLAHRHKLPSPDFMLGKTDFDFFPEAQARQFLEDEHAIIRTGEPVIDKLQKQIWQDGTVAWGLTTKLPLRNEHGEIIGTFGISRDVTASRRLQEQLETTHKELVDASRKAGMADVATGVLHNVGNVLNSVNVAAEMLADGLRRSRVESVSRLAALVSDHAADLPAFFATAKGGQIPSYLVQLAEHLTTERTRHLAEIAELRKYIDHIKDVVTMQQSFAGSPGLIEPHDPVALVEDSIRLNAGALARHAVEVIREFVPSPRVLADRTRVLQILVNLLRNAKHALDEGAPAEKRLILRIEPTSLERVRISVVDNGIGILPENLDRIFAHGFTTRKNGHGFGLHSAANAAEELGGTLTVRSEGPGHGATFVLELPVASETASSSTSDKHSSEKARTLLLKPESNA